MVEKPRRVARLYILYTRRIVPFRTLCLFLCPTVLPRIKSGLDEKMVGNGEGRDSLRNHRFFWRSLFLSPYSPLFLYPLPLPVSANPHRGKKHFNSADESSLILLYVGHQSKRAQDDVEGATKRREEARRRRQADERMESLSSLAEDDGFGLAPLGLLVDVGREEERVCFYPAKGREE